MMCKVQPTSKYKSDVKRLQKRGHDLTPLKAVAEKLANGETLPEQYYDHQLKEKRSGYRDCHIQNNWVLIYKIDKGILTLVLSETGTRSDILE